MSSLGRIGHLIQDCLSVSYCLCVLIMGDGAAIAFGWLIFCFLAVAVEPIIF